MMKYYLRYKFLSILILIMALFFSLTVVFLPGAQWENFLHFFSKNMPYRIACFFLSFLFLYYLLKNLQALWKDKRPYLILAVGEEGAVYLRREVVAKGIKKILQEDQVMFKAKVKIKQETAGFEVWIGGKYGSAAPTDKAFEESQAKLLKYLKEEIGLKVIKIKFFFENKT